MDANVSKFVAENPQSVLVTHRLDGGLQASPVRALVDSAGRIVACTRSVTAKAKNLGRDPRFALCVMTSAWQGPWITFEGTAELVTLPAALGALQEFYQQRDGKILPTEEFAELMHSEARLVVRFEIERVAGTALSL